MPRRLFTALELDERWPRHERNLMPNVKRVPRMEWQLQAIMGQRRIRTATDLQRALQEIGVEVSSAQLSRLMNSNPSRISSEVMYGLTRVLECTASDLWRNPHQKAGATSVPPPTGAEGATPSSVPGQSAGRKQRREAAAKPEVSVVGPTFEAYPVKDA